jgi:hypothetical protein
MDGLGKAYADAMKVGCGCLVVLFVLGILASSGITYLVMR